MPIYTYKCQNCGSSFEEVVSVKKRHSPTKKECSQCHKKALTLSIGTGIVEGDPVRFKKKNRTQFKEMMTRIKEHHRGSKIDIK